MQQKKNPDILALTIWEFRILLSSYKVLLLLELISSLNCTIYVINSIKTDFLCIDWKGSIWGVNIIKIQVVRFTWTVRFISTIIQTWDDNSVWCLYNVKEWRLRYYLKKKPSHFSNASHIWIAFVSDKTGWFLLNDIISILIFKIKKNEFQIHLIFKKWSLTISLFF